MYRTINRAANDWLADKEHKVDRYRQVKIRFLFSDLRRFANFNMRCAQFLKALHPRQDLFEQGRRLANAWEIKAGLNWWFRQLELHAGLYRF